MANFFFTKDGTEIDIEDTFKVRVTSVRGLNAPQPKELIKRDWANEDGVDVYLPEERKCKSSEVVMTVLAEDRILYNAREQYDAFCAYIFNGYIGYRDTVQNKSATLIYDSSKPVWFQFTGQNKIFFEVTFLNPSGKVT